MNLLIEVLDTWQRQDEIDIAIQEAVLEYGHEDFDAGYSEGSAEGYREGWEDAMTEKEVTA